MSQVDLTRFNCPECDSFIQEDISGCPHFNSNKRGHVFEKIVNIPTPIQVQYDPNTKSGDIWVIKFPNSTEIETGKSIEDAVRKLSRKLWG